MAVSEGRNFVSMGIRPELLRSVRYYCQILVEDVRTHEALLQVRTHTVPRENDQTNVVWNDSIYLYPPSRLCLSFQLGGEELTRHNTWADNSRLA